MRVLLFVFICLVTSCYSPRKAERQLAKVNANYPEKVAQICIDKYPAKVTGTDTLIEYDWIEVIDTLHDTIIREKSDRPAIGNKTNYVRTNTVQKLVRVNYYITKKVEDSAKIKIYQAKFDLLTKKKLAADRWAFACWLIAAVLFILLMIIIRKR